MLEYGLRLKHRQRSISTNDQEMSPGILLFEKALEGGNRALARKSGKLTKGYRADLIVIDPNNPGLVHHEPDSLLDALIFGCSTNPVKDVMVGGSWKIKDGKHEQEEQIFDSYKKSLANLIR